MKRFLISLLCALGLALSALPTRAQMDKPFATIVRGKRGKHLYRLRFVTRYFRKDNHQTSGTGFNATIDGNKNFFGTDGSFPYTEFKSLLLRERPPSPSVTPPDTLGGFPE